MRKPDLTIAAVKAFAIGYHDGRIGWTEKPPYTSEYLNDWYTRGKESGVADNHRDSLAKES